MPPESFCRYDHDNRISADPPEPKYRGTNESAAHIRGVEIAARALVSSPNVPLRSSIVLSGTGVPQMSVHDSTSLGWTSMMSPWRLWSWTTDKRSEYWGSGRLWCDGRLWTGRGCLVGGQPCAWPSGCDCACRLVEARGPDPAWCGRNQSSSTPLDRYPFSAPGCTAIRTYSAVTPELFDQLIVEGERWGCTVRECGTSSRSQLNLISTVPLEWGSPHRVRNESWAVIVGV